MHPRRTVALVFVALVFGGAGAVGAEIPSRSWTGTPWWPLPSLTTDGRLGGLPGASRRETSAQVPMSPATRKPKPWGRVSLYTNSSRVAVPGRSAASTSEFVSSITYQLAERSDDGLEFGLDLRHSGFMSEEREARLSIYDGFVGARLAGGALRLRGGHMWLNDLGGLGAVAGGLVEVRQRPSSTVRLGRLRGGAFGGLEPRLYRSGYEPAVRKYGGYIALDGDGARKHVAGLIHVQHGGLTERSVLSFTNFIPVGRRVFVYQAAEYDVQRPSGKAKRGLNYFFTNARFSPLDRLELQMTVSRGRSIDARGLSEDVLAGRPVSPQSIEGLLYQSVGGRATVEIFRGARVFVGHTRDKDNHDDASTARWISGAYLSNVGGSGFDVTVSDNLIDRPRGSYHSRYFSVGRQVGRRVYVTGDYSSSLSVVRFLRSDGIMIETRPETSRFGSSAVVTLGRAFSVLASGEYTRDGEVQDLRMIAGVTYRLR